MLKAQTDILSAVIIVILALSLTSAALIWGLPLIQKRQDTIVVARVSNALSQDLPSRIEHIANTGGLDTFSLDVDGIWSLDEINNVISFSFSSSVSDKGLNQWIGKDCPFNPSQTGTMGIDSSSVICSFATQSGTGFNITYQLGFRGVVTGDGTKIYQIDLVKPSGGVTTSTGKNIQISRKSVDQSQIGQKTLITTEVEILL